MTTRLLPFTEWHRLVGTELATVYPHLDPASASIVVVEDGEQIVGCWARFSVTHLEGVYIAPAYRRSGSVARRLLGAMRSHLVERGIKAAMTSALSDDVATLAQRIGAQPMPGQHFLLTVEQ
jgi:ribosomal protein S18 acetylase RimI-like enzyme